MKSLQIAILVAVVEGIAAFNIIGVQPEMPRITTRQAATAYELGDLAEEVRDQFPILSQSGQGGNKLVYLDSGATSQKPLAVLDAVDNYYREANANVHRGAHFLANRATERYESARDKVAAFVGASRREEIVFTAGATEAINLVVNTWGAANLGPGDEVILSVAEHHANLVPWQMLAERQGVLLNFVGVDEDMRYDLKHLQSLITPRTKLIGLAHVSNVLGAVNPVKEVVALAQTVGARVLLDACQSVPHMPVNAQALGVDWLVASGHKMCGPTGIGFLWGKYEVLEASPPWQGGGEMIDEVFLEHSTFAPPPGRFEAGTPPIAQAIGMGAACDFLSGIGMERVHAHERKLGRYLWDSLKGEDLGGLVLYGPSPEACEAAPWESPCERVGLVAFTSPAVHASDLTFFLDQEGVAVRSGHHCAQPLHRDVFKVGASTRASLYIHNDESDVDALCMAIRSSLKMFEDI